MATLKIESKGLTIYVSGERTTSTKDGIDTVHASFAGACKRYGLDAATIEGDLKAAFAAEIAAEYQARWGERVDDDSLLTWVSEGMDACDTGHGWRDNLDPVEWAEELHAAREELERRAYGGRS